MTPLANPEAAWSRAVLPVVERSEIEKRIGPTSEPIEVLSGGFANKNVRVGDRVLRIKPNASTLAKERALLSHAWRSFRTPRVLDSGDDFLVLEHLDLAPLTSTTGALVGAALAEIHARKYAQTGFLDAELNIETPFPPDGSGFSDGGVGYVKAMLSEAEPFLDPSLPPKIRASLDENASKAASAMDGPVLTHCDFKVANLFTCEGDLVVLDWDFAWAGPRLLDIGQLLRWSPPPEFERDFANAYVAAGGVLVDDWKRVATLIDVGHMLGVFAHNPIMRTAPDIPRRIEAIVADVG